MRYEPGRRRAYGRDQYKQISLLEEYFGSLSPENIASYATQQATSSTSKLVKWMMKNRQAAPSSQVDDI
jgi:hypothetical protein